MWVNELEIANVRSLHIIKVKEKGKNRREGKGKKKSSKKPEEA
jgi:hypothetical protein